MRQVLPFLLSFTLSRSKGKAVDLSKVLMKYLDKVRFSLSWVVARLIITAIIANFAELSRN